MPGTQIDDAPQTVQREPDATNSAWLQGESGDLVLQLFDDPDDSTSQVDITNIRFSCSYRWYFATVEEKGIANDTRNPLKATITEHVPATADDIDTPAGSLTVVPDSDPATGIISIYIAKDFWPNEVAPNLDSNVPVALLAITQIIDQGQPNEKNRKFRHELYYRAGGAVLP